MAESKEKRSQGSDEGARGNDQPGPDAVEHGSHGNLNQRKRIEVSSSKGAEGLCVEAEVFDEVGGDHRIGDAVKGREDVKDGESGKDENRPDEMTGSSR